MKNKPLKEKINRPNKVLQFGEGNFLRAFVDYIIDCSNEAGTFDGNITIIKPIEFGNLDWFNQQDNLYTVILRGVKNGETSVENHIVSSVTKTVDPFSDLETYHQLMENEAYRFIVSNTTEAGIVYSDKDKFEDELPNTFPAKVTKLLYQRFELFGGDINKGFIFLPVELIEKNGDHLKKCILKYIDLWNLSDPFKDWVLNANIFCNTLVDRIVSGYPKAEEDAIWQELGYKDELMVTGEPFGFWAIGSDKIEQVEKELTLKSNVQVVFAKDIEPYKQRKVRILNGAHTSMVLGAYRYGKEIVEECMNDDVIKNYMLSCIYDEIIPTINLDKKELEEFASSVVERFKNPFLNHKLLDISLNSTSKWRARVMPSLIDYYEMNGKIPEKLAFSFALYLAFYMGIKKTDGGYVNQCNGKTYPVKDDEDVLKLYAENSEASNEVLVELIMKDEKLWGIDLTTIDGFYEMIKNYISNISQSDVKTVMTSIVHFE